MPSFWIQVTEEQLSAVAMFLVEKGMIEPQQASEVVERRRLTLDKLALLPVKR